VLDIYLNQLIPWKQRMGVNDANEGTFASEVNIKVRFTYKRSLVRTATGEDVMTNAVLHTKTVISENDVVIYDNKEWKLRFVYPWIDIDGKKVGYRAVL
jgi:hypothetical protein